MEIRDLVTNHINNAVIYRKKAETELVCYQKSKEVVELILEISKEFENRYLKMKYLS